MTTWVLLDPSSTTTIMSVLIAEILWDDGLGDTRLLWFWCFDFLWTLWDKFGKTFEEVVTTISASETTSTP